MDSFAGIVEDGADKSHPVQFSIVIPSVYVFKEK